MHGFRLNSPLYSLFLLFQPPLATFPPYHPAQPTPAPMPPSFQGKMAEKKSHQGSLGIALERFFTVRYCDDPNVAPSFGSNPTPCERAFWVR